MNNETYIEKKISCPSCKTGIEFAIKLTNVNLVDVKINTKCSECGTTIIITPSNLIGIINEVKQVEETLPNIIQEEIDMEVPKDISSFFDEVEDNILPQENIEYNEMEENRKKREYINDIFS